jgi:hypothetical protein
MDWYADLTACGKYIQLGQIQRCPATPVNREKVIVERMKENELHRMKAHIPLKMTLKHQMGSKNHGGVLWMGAIPSVYPCSRAKIRRFVYWWTGVPRDEGRNRVTAPIKRSGSPKLVASAGAHCGIAVYPVCSICESAPFDLGNVSVPIALQS